MARPRKPLAIDLFCGAGGMSLGFEQAGFNVAAAFDREDWNIKTYRRNFPFSLAHARDLSKCDGAMIRKLSKIKNRSIDVVFGGPPCQGFSMGGKRDLDDKRNLLIYDFARLVRELKPKYFVMENVAGLMQSHSEPAIKSFVRRVKLAGYGVVEPIEILNAADFGVPQNRRRSFVLGYRKDLKAFDYPETVGCRNEAGQEFNPVVRDALCDLPKIEKFDVLFEVDFYRGTLGKPSSYSSILRGETRLENDHSRQRRRVPDRLTGCLRTMHSSKTKKRFAKTKPGTDEPVSRYFRLDPKSFARTIRAGTGVDHGSHTAPRPIHPTEPRCITTREAARLHSFPDWFEFHPTRWHGFRQIGNSVPPLFARAIGNSLFEEIRNGS